MFWAFLCISQAPFGRSLWSGHNWKDPFLLQKLSIDNANFGQKWWCQKWKKSQGSSRPVTGGTGVNGLNKLIPTAASMLAKSWATPERNVPPLAPGVSLVLLSEIVMPLGGFEAPERSNHLVSIKVGFYCSHSSIRLTLGYCVIAEPASLQNMVQWYDTSDPGSRFCLDFFIIWERQRLNLSQYFLFLSNVLMIIITDFVRNWVKIFLYKRLS